MSGNDDTGREQRPPDTVRPPSEMRLRSTRPPVTRLSRRVLLSLAALGATGVGGALYYALRPSGPVKPPELYNTGNRNTPDGLAGLPRDYSQLPHATPRLGAPLPGDLGGPMLRAGVAGPVMATPTRERDPQAQKMEQERDAARLSRLFTQTQTAHEGPATTGTTSTTPGAADKPVPAETDSKKQFLNGPADRQTVSADRVGAPASPFTLMAGSIIPAALATGIRSELPGDITARVTENVYDSRTGHILLIPQGSILFGVYNSQVGFGQTRVQMVWTRLIFPDTRALTLQRLPGMDASGYTGLHDRVDNHWGQVFEAAILSTILSIGSEADISSGQGGIAQALRMGASQSFNQAGEQIVARSLSIRPTAVNRPGLPMRVMVKTDLVLRPYGETEE
ncbi:TrbI/VirB10 family protein [Komagataeibacter diospyri]|uniref:Conjugal transfer protein TrbI n=1 Tax=Komagataeibacter diospyri TaxID=1932662 RepID=A0A4P5P2Z3_9PROT|nr:TrbI/VirB10 family protein [Komagataeibacter diospyri]GCE84526.1 conjugal transfer protein TrbI [Komagataeibacter diospyri]